MREVETLARWVVNHRYPGSPPKLAMVHTSPMMLAQSGET